MPRRDTSSWRPGGRTALPPLKPSRRQMPMKTVAHGAGQAPDSSSLSTALLLRGRCSGDHEWTAPPQDSALIESSLGPPKGVRRSINQPSQPGERRRVPDARQRKNCDSAASGDVTSPGAGAPARKAANVGRGEAARKVRPPPEGRLRRCPRTPQGVKELSDRGGSVRKWRGYVPDRPPSRGPSAARAMTGARLGKMPPAPVGVETE